MKLIDLKSSEGIATVTFNRPEALNALNRQVLEEFGKLVLDLEGRLDVRVVILTGSGEKAFIAGADIKEMKPLDASGASAFSALGQDALAGLERLPQITIAAVNGFALGGGCEVAMACDLIYASENAKFGQPEVNLGVIPGFGGTQRLTRLVGPMKARELIYTGDMIDAKEAERLGLVARVFPKEKLLDEVNAIARVIASKGPQALHRAKLSIRNGMDVELNRACTVEREQFALCFAHPDQKEGMAAFLEKRKPKWGRPE